MADGDGDARRRCTPRTWAKRPMLPRIGHYRDRGEWQAPPLDERTSCEAGKSCGMLLTPVPKYLVSYIVRQEPFEYREHFVTFTDDFAKILRDIVGRKGLLKKFLKQYQESDYVILNAANPSLRRVIKHITIRELPEKHDKILVKYVWRPPRRR